MASRPREGGIVSVGGERVVLEKLKRNREGKKPLLGKGIKMIEEDMKSTTVLRKCTFMFLTLFKIIKYLFNLFYIVHRIIIIWIGSISVRLANSFNVLRYGRLMISST